MSDQHELATALARLEDRLNQLAAPRAGQDPPPPDGDEVVWPESLERLGATFDLSSFERELLLLCAGMELTGGFAAACAAAAGDPRAAYPTFALAMRALADGHFSAIAPWAPLRRFRLIEVEAGTSITRARLHLDERVLHHLLGLEGLDERLQGLLEPLPASGLELPPSQLRLVERIREIWSAPRSGMAPALLLGGPDAAEKAAVAAMACAGLGLRLFALRAGDIPSGPHEREQLARLWEREAVLGVGALLVEIDDTDSAEAGRNAAAFAERVLGLVIVASRDPLPLRRRPLVRLEVARPSAAEQESLWHAVLGPTATRLNGQIAGVVSQFRLGVPAMRAVSLELDGRGGDDRHDALWDACRLQARPRLDDLAQRIDPAAGWHDLVLPRATVELLQALAAQVRQRARVYEQWGFAGKGARGLGITALFSGPSGTGKTMAAEVLARDLGLDLYRIDLSQVVSKYIGETEKNLRRIFDAAEEGGAVLLFDEADALFGKRSEVKDSHDRYANLEVSYLLQRMEAYRGLAVLTTNMRSALDVAFLRRLRFVANFPFPDAEQRAEIWRKIFPSETPTQDLDPLRLARLNVAGGSIRNIALCAAFLAADAGEPVTMAHLGRAVRSEFAKLERPLSEAEVGGWA